MKALKSDRAKKFLATQDGRTKLRQFVETGRSDAMEFVLRSDLIQAKKRPRRAVKSFLDAVLGVNDGQDAR
jgi:hypothetical protein